MRVVALCALLAACVPEPTFRGIGSQPEDAPPDAAVGSITVRTYSRDLMQSLQLGVQVYFINNDGTIRGEQTTGGSGEVIGEIEEGGTLIVRYDNLIAIVTRVTLEKTYTFGAAQTTFNPRGNATANVTRVAGAPNYRVFAPCGEGVVSDGSVSNPVPVPFTWKDGCGSASTVGVMAYHSTGAGVVASTRFHMITNGATPTFMMNAVPSLPVMVTMNVTGNEDLASVTPAVSAIEGTTRYGGTPFTTIAPGQTMSTGTYFRATLLGQLYTQYAMTTAVTEHGPQMLAEYAETPSTPAPYTLERDLSPAARAPFVSRPVPDAEPTTFRWTQSPEGAANFVALDIGIIRVVDATSVTRNIRFFFPPEYLAGGLPQVALPPLPDALADFVPVVGDMITPVLSMTRVNDGVAYADIAGIYDLYVRAVVGDPSRLLETSATTGITHATLSKSP